MNKKLSVFILLALLCFSALGLMEVKADTTNPIGSSFEFSLTTRFGNAIPTETSLGVKDYGSKVVIDADSYASSGYDFVAYIVNDKLEPTLPANNEFIVSEDLDVLALYKEDTTYAVTFVDSNREFVTVQFVDQSGTADAIPPDPSSFSKPGYSLSTTPWSGSYEDVTEDRTLYVQYDKVIADSYTVTVENGDGGGSFGYNEVATVTATGTGTFQYWLNNGELVSLQSTYSFTVLHDHTLTAVYFNDEETTFSSESLFITLSQPYDFIGGYNTFVAQFYLPAGNDLVEYGLMTYDGDGSFDLSTGVGVTKYRCNNYFAETGEFMASLDTSYPANTRAYMVTTDGTTETVTYSFTHDNLLISEYGEGSSNNKWIEIYNPNNYAVDLSEYRLFLFGNGSVTPTAEEDFAGVTLAANDVYVIYNSSAVQDIKDNGDASSAACNFNGNDALGLFRIGVILDQVGVIGSSDTFAENTTLNRQVAYENPSSVYDASEWDSSAIDTFTDIGLHNPQAPTSITITGDTSVYVGSTIDLDVTYPGNTLEGVTWSSSNELLATVDVDGIVTAVADGSVTITATSTEDGSVDDTHSVTVNPIVQYTVSYEENGGSTVTNETVDSGTTATEPTDPTLADYTFDAWYTDNNTFANEFLFTTEIIDNISLYAHWLENFTVTYNTDGGTAVSSEEVADGFTATEPNDPTKADNTFGGWYTDAGCTEGNEFTFDTAIVVDITLYAKWVAAGGEVLAYSTTFESSEGFTASTTYNNTTEKFFGNTGEQWATYYGTPSTTAEIEGLQSMQCRWYTSAPANIGYARTDFTVTDVTKVVFNAKGNDGLDVEVSYSIDGGSTWIGAETFDLSTSSVQYTYTINATGNVMIKFTLVLPDPLSTSTSEFYLDEVEIYHTT